MESLEGKTAVVLGASSPYGAATARMLAREGVRLALGGRSRKTLEALEREIRSSGGEVVVVGTHLAKRHHLRHLMEAATEAFGGLDILLFMAHASAAPLASLEVESWERSVDVNIKGFLYAIAAALPIMSERDGGHVVSVDAGGSGSPGPLYEASRAAVRVLLRELAEQFSGEGIRASELRLADLQRTDPEECAKTVHRVLIGA